MPNAVVTLANKKALAEVALSLSFFLFFFFITLAKQKHSNQKAV